MLVSSATLPPLSLDSASWHVAAANNATVHCEAVAAPPTTALQPVYTLGYTLLPASCCEFHFRCDILLQNFIFNLCTYYTACHAQHSTPLLGISLSVYVCPTYLAFVFIFSVIVLFLPCHGNCFLSFSLSPCHCMCPCYLSSVDTFGPFARQAHAVDYYYEHYDRISLTAQNVSSCASCW